MLLATLLGLLQDIPEHHIQQTLHTLELKVKEGLWTVKLLNNRSAG
jgi:hypothetical protein